MDIIQFFNFKYRAALKKLKNSSNNSNSIAQNTLKLTITCF